MIKWLKKILRTKNDPLHNCNLHLDVSCPHVGGMLCDFDTCEMREDYDIQKIIDMPYDEIMSELPSQELDEVKAMQKRIRDSIGEHKRKMAEYEL